MIRARLAATDRVLPDLCTVLLIQCDDLELLNLLQGMACATNLYNFNLALFRLVPSGDWYLWYNLSRDLLFLLLLKYNIEWTHLLGTTRLRAEALGALKTWTERLRF